MRPVQRLMPRRCLAYPAPTPVRCRRAQVAWLVPPVRLRAHSDLAVRVVPVHVRVVLVVPVVPVHVRVVRVVLVHVRVVRVVLVHVRVVPVVSRRVRVAVIPVVLVEPVVLAVARPELVAVVGPPVDVPAPVVGVQRPVLSVAPVASQPVVVSQSARSVRNSTTCRPRPATAFRYRVAMVRRCVFRVEHH